jgi:hypothetical protein
MITRAIDSGHDWKFGNGVQDYLSEDRALAQNINTRLLSFKNDCFFDLGAGVDWFYYLGSKRVSSLKIEITSIIEKTTGITAVEQLSLSLGKDRDLVITYQVSSAWGTTVNSSISVG